MPKYKIIQVDFVDLQRDRLLQVSSGVEIPFRIK